MLGPAAARPRSSKRWPGFSRTSNSPLPGTRSSRQFKTFKPGAPAIANTLTALNYGDGLYVKVAQATVWDQPALPDVHTQDVWFIRALTRVSADGEETDFLPVLLDHLASDASPGVVIRSLGVTFSQSGSVSARAVNSVGAPMPSISVTVGTISNGVSYEGISMSSPLASLLFPHSDEIVALFTTPRVDRAPINLGPDDDIELDLTGIDGLIESDRLTAEFAFAQLRAPLNPLLEDGLSPVERFVRRWDQGQSQILSVENAEGELEFAYFPDVDLGIIREPRHRRATHGCTRLGGKAGWGRVSRGSARAYWPRPSRAPPAQGPWSQDLSLGSSPPELRSWERRWSMHLPRRPRPHP